MPAKPSADAMSKNKPAKKKIFPIILLAVFLALIGCITVLMVFNILGIRENIVMPYLRNAPLIGSLMPQPAAETDGGQADANASLSAEELRNQIQLLEFQIQKLEDDLKTANEQAAEDAETIRILRGYEAIIEEYRQVKAQFDQMVVDGDPKGYAAYYESISPENAERLYKEAVSEIQYSAEEKNLANIYANMSEDTAAAALEHQMTLDSELVVRILRNMDSVHVAAIMDEMAPANVAVLIRLMAPTPTPVLPVQTAPPVPTPTPVPTDSEQPTP